MEWAYEKEARMNLKEYFETTRGKGVLATADADGKVDAAIYARPHILDDGSLALIARERLTRHNLESNPHAAYLFVEDGPGYKGKRFFLTKIREEKESELLYELRRRKPYPEEDIEKDPKYLIIFNVDKELPLVGPGD